MKQAPEHQRALQARCVHPTGAFTLLGPADLEQSIPDRFAQQARLHADRLAIANGADQITYGDLDLASNGIARAILERHGPGPEPVALLLPHGGASLAAMLGVLKTGKFYVPLDPAAPRARLAYMLDDSRSRLLVTDDAHAGQARDLAGDGCQVLVVGPVARHLAPERPAIPIGPDELAYLIYTSGSAGRPKGVMQTHRNVLHKVLLSVDAYHICAEDQRSLTAPPTYSGAVWAIFGALCTGATLHPFDPQRRGVTELVRWLRDDGITILTVVPTLFRQVAAALTPADTLPALRVLSLGGEAVTPRDVELYRRHCPPSCLLFFTLAATEAGTLCQYFMDRKTPLADGVVPAGYPVQDKEVLILDDAGNPVADGQEGEIAVRSRYLSPGYWRRPDLTRAAFQSSDDGSGSTLYRTGDRGRRLPDGCVVHTGRVDLQVKVRGHRIEVAEVEAALLEIDAIKDAVVQAREDRPGDQRLVAYCVPSGGHAPAVSALRSHVAARVPAHMVPSIFVMLPALPLTPNGKVDRHALPPPGPLRPPQARPYVAPRTAVEEMLARIWGDVLGVDQVGVHDAFLELGGHSILAGEILARVIRQWKLVLPVQTLFEAPTVAAMAVVIAGHQAASAGEGDVGRMLAEVERLSDDDVRRLSERGS